MTKKADAFLSFAEPDKSTVADPLAESLRVAGVRVWFAPWEMRVGDSVRQVLDLALARSRYGIVILSPNFFSRYWPQVELDGFVQRETDGKPVILPIWHELSHEEVRKYSITLAGRFALRWSDGVTSVSQSLVRAIRGDAAAELAKVQALDALAIQVEERLRAHYLVRQEQIGVKVRRREDDLVVELRKQKAIEHDFIRDALRKSESPQRWEAAIRDVESEICLTVGMWYDLGDVSSGGGFSEK